VGDRSAQHFRVQDPHMDRFANGASFKVFLAFMEFCGLKAAFCCSIIVTMQCGRGQRSTGMSNDSYRDNPLDFFRTVLRVLFQFTRNASRNSLAALC